MDDAETKRVNRAVHALAGLVAVMRNENLRRLELAWGAAITAEWAHFVALGVFAYDAGGPVAVGIAGLVRMLPAALVAPFAASLGDRFRRERFLVSIALVGAAALAASAVVFFVSENAPAIFALAAVVGLASTLVRPAQQALLPSLARTPEELIGSNGASSTVESLGTLIGPLLAGVLVSVADAGVVFAVGAGALLAGALLFALVRVEGRLHAAADVGTETARRLLVAGIAYVVRTPTPRTVVGLVAAQAFVRGCLNVLIVVTAFRVFDANAGAVGYMTAALGVGGLVGALGAFTLGGHRLAVAFGVALGSIIAPALVSLVGPRAALVAVGVILPLLALFSSRRLVEIDRNAPGPAAELSVIDRVPMFAPLSLAAKEHLARTLVPVSVAAGEVVIRAGEPGDRFYMIVDGELEVVAERLQVTARAGDHFGEIALLRDVPRTATVRAVLDSHLYALDRSDFLAAVTGHSGVRAAGETVAAERLARGGETAARS